jgi:hypothetical protein
VVLPASFGKNSGPFWPQADKQKTRITQAKIRI